MTFNNSLESIRCKQCGLLQYSTLSTVCKKCGASLGIRYATLAISQDDVDKKDSPERLARAFGDMIRATRHVRGLSQEETAHLLHISRPQVSRLEAGRIKPSFSLLFRATARLFSVDRVILRIQIPQKRPPKS